MKTVCAIFMLQLVFAFGDWSDNIITEGDEALINFRYVSESPGPYSLSIGFREPFYKEGQLILDSLTASQQKRFKVHAWHSRVHQYTLIQVVIENVQRSDGGSYTSRFGGNETSLQGTKQIALTVNFPPGRARCWTSQEEREGWEEIRCAAKGGSPPGVIVCRNMKTEEIFGKTEHSQNATHILNKFWVQHKTSAYCCAKNEINQHIQLCHDFVLSRDETSNVDQSSTKPGSVIVTQFDTTTQITDSPNALTEYYTEDVCASHIFIICISVSITASSVALLIAVILYFSCKSKCSASESTSVLQSKSPGSGIDDEEKTRRQNDNSTCNVSEAKPYISNSSDDQALPNTKPNA